MSDPLLPELPRAIELTQADRYRADLHLRLYTLLDDLDERAKVLGIDLAELAAAVAAGGFPAWGSSAIRHMVPNPGGTIPEDVGFNNVLVGGTGTYVAPTSTDLFTSLGRHRYSGLANIQCGFNSRTPIFWRGNAAGFGGFTVEAVFGLEVNSAVYRLFIGLGENANINLSSTGGNPSARLNCIFLGADSGDTNLQIMHNDGAGVCTKVDLGATFPKVPAVRSVCKVRFSCAANGSGIDYSVEDLTAGTSITGTATTDLPSNTTFLNFQLASGHTTAGNSETDFMRMIAQCPE